ncbi:hypothetical protein AAFP32_13370 [Brevibacterium sp. CBA3109]|uniref:Uncharacterized protein n=1 Tax=Brevibacterium koreense TaxID=3140787 RepID=A0AAU7UJ18_9MICO
MNALQRPVLNIGIVADGVEKSAFVPILGAQSIAGSDDDPPRRP